ncbi:MAG: protein phosphatase 2C domain-containing protein [Bacteroidales bacterium]|nr:protein phosphatase 2C domain-containing protein [Bacteroidales bacterium]
MIQYKIANPIRIQHQGNRANQEDNTYPTEQPTMADDRVFILCDGMGGHDRGEVASRTVCESMGAWLKEHWKADEPLTWETFNQALFAAYEALDKEDDVDDTKKMGTTMTFLALHAGGASIAHIGDSRVYHIRPASAEGPASIVSQTRDHSLVNDLIRLGELTEEEARTAPNRNVITRAMQPHQERRARADWKDVADVRPGDYFYMCSDGMLEQMDNSELLELIAAPQPTDSEKGEELLRRTAQNRDNHTAFLVHVLEVTGETHPAPPTDNAGNEVEVCAVAVEPADCGNDAPLPARRMGRKLSIRRRRIRRERACGLDFLGKGSLSGKLSTVLMLLVAVLSVLALLYFLLGKK